MKRAGVVLVLAVVATAAFLGVGRGLVGGSLRLQLPGGAPAPTAAVHGGGEQRPVDIAPIVPPAGSSRVNVTVGTAARQEQGYLVSVQVMSPAGKPVNDATIRFYDVVDLFGQREALIGTGVTDGQGVAAIGYLPARLGEHYIVARFAGQGSLTPSVGTTTLNATVAAPTYRTDEPRLAAFNRYMPYAAGAVVLAVWALIAFAMFGTARGVIAGARQTHRKGETA